GIDVPQLVLGQAVNVRALVVSTDPLLVRVIRSGDVVVEVTSQTYDTQGAAHPVNQEGEADSQLGGDAVRAASGPSPSAGPPPGQRNAFLALTQLLQTRLRLADELAQQVLGAQTSVAPRPPVPRLAIGIGLVAAIGFLALWGDLLWRYVQRRLQAS